MLAALAVAVGPGSFTALRVGLAAAKAVADATALPIIGITNTEAAASLALREHPDAQTGLVLLPASRGEVYLAPFAATRGEPATQMTAETEVAKLSNWRAEENKSAGTAFDVIACPRGDILAEAATRPWAEGATYVDLPESLVGAMGQLAWQRFERRAFDSSHTLDAAYVRRADADKGWVDPKA